MPTDAELRALLERWRKIYMHPAAERPFSNGVRGCCDELESLLRPQEPEQAARERKTVTNREIAEALVRDHSASDDADAIDAIESALNTAAREARHDIECDGCGKHTGGHDSVTCLPCGQKNETLVALKAKIELLGRLDASRATAILEFIPRELARLRADLAKETER